MLRESFERRALKLVGTSLATATGVGTGFVMMNVRSDLMLVVGGAVTLASAILGVSRVLKLIAREKE